MSRTDVLVDADWVEAHLDDPKVVLVEVDEDTAAYDKNHIRNAVRIDWRDDLQDAVRRDSLDRLATRHRGGTRWHDGRGEWPDPDPA